MKGLVSEITSFSTHDGPGIRTTVFLKGCPLRCKWCSNPETFTMEKRLFYIAKKCRGCGRCEAVCPEGAIGEREKGFRRIDRKTCNLCQKCLDVCMAGAFQISGQEYTAEKLFERILREKPFYGKNGGLTMSGGEALSQWEFTAEVFSLCRAEGISNVLDTTGYGSDEALEGVLPLTDLCLLDIKHMNDGLHRQWTGVSNKRILANARRIAGQVETRISLPLVAEVNNTPQNLHETAEFAVSCHIQWIDLNPLHMLGASKYHFLGKNSPYGKFRKLEKSEVEEACRILKSHGLSVSVGRMM